ncbi:CHAD domain-containing protein [Desulfoprunum benzoelyticum]|uniref:CHAD domain-containing protein n=1 Tax=Desulfoprunum benzoelyticum TaxID=1506996 RepID=A0A840USZ6_9BACT|nr:CHAD domain-containing protein [Desulfoprunum benzoelyticum]MBB5348785.1 CHAD domain-containing protein [Desulfoprunum benzoelyticum]MBM9529948.1 CHAD domain-containing protein [Desulfoprunum benzoelyticum]
MIEQIPSSIFFVDADFDVAAIALRLDGDYAVSEEEVDRGEEEFLDTFEWGLYWSGLALARRGRRYRLFSADGVVLGEGKGPRRKRPFWWDFPDGPIRDGITAGADIRALCPKLRMSRVRRSFHLLNVDEKTVLRLWLDHVVVGGDNQGPVEQTQLRLAAIRGYEHEYQAVRRLLQAEGLGQLVDGMHFLDPVFAGAGITVESVGSKTVVILERDISMGDGLRQVGLAVLGDIRRNLPGTIEDIDTEFLHDLRISLRRTRSLLTLFCKVFPEIHCNHYRSEFRWITQTTGKVRDSDVYLLKEGEYRSMLPASLHSGLDGFVRGMRAYRSREFRAMKKQLTSPRLARLLKDWQHFLENLPQPAEVAGRDLLCRNFAAKAVRKRFRKILAEGEKLGPDSPDTMLHALRIEAKKLRYLLEFFHSLFPAEDVILLVKHLKKLQNNLGDYNDLSVQQEMLGTFRSPVRVEDPKQVLVIAAALGGLVVRLADRQRQVRGEFDSTFADFSGDESRELVQRITRPAEDDHFSAGEGGRQ